MDPYDFATNAIGAAKYVLTSIIAVFYIVIIIIGISSDYNEAGFGGPVIELMLLAGVLILLACNEGFQVGILGIEHLNVNDIEEKGFERTTKIHKLMFSSDVSRIKQLLIGQSFLVVLCSFIIAHLTTFANFPAFDGKFLVYAYNFQFLFYDRCVFFNNPVCSIIFISHSVNISTIDFSTPLAGISEIVMDIFIRSGLPGAFVTICCAQLLPSMLSKGTDA